MVVIGAAAMFSDEWLVCEDNALAADWAFQWLASVSTLVMSYVVCRSVHSITMWKWQGAAGN